MCGYIDVPSKANCRIDFCLSSRLSTLSLLAVFSAHTRPLRAFPTPFEVDGLCFSSNVFTAFNASWQSLSCSLVTRRGPRDQQSRTRTTLRTRRGTRFHIRNNRLDHAKNAIKSVDFVQEAGKFGGISSDIVNVSYKQRNESLCKCDEPSEAGSTGQGIHRPRWWGRRHENTTWAAEIEISASGIASLIA